MHYRSSAAVGKASNFLRKASTTSPSYFGPRGVSPQHGRSTSARWRSARRPSAPTIPIPCTCGTTSPLSFGASGHEKLVCSRFRDPGRSSNSRGLPFDAGCSATAFSARPAREPICDRSAPQKISSGRVGRFRRRSALIFPAKCELAHTPRSIPGSMVISKRNQE